MNADRPDEAVHAWWLLSRSAGVVALVLVAVSVLIGLTLAAGLGGPPRAPPRARGVPRAHRARRA